MLCDMPIQDDRDLRKDPAIVAFRHSGDFSAAMSTDHSVSPKPPKSPHVRSPSKPSAVTGQNMNASNNVNSYMQRETGVIEKLLVCTHLFRHLCWKNKLHTVLQSSYIAANRQEVLSQLT